MIEGHYPLSKAEEMLLSLVDGNPNKDYYDTYLYINELRSHTDYIGGDWYGKPSYASWEYNTLRQDCPHRGQ